MFFPSSHRVWPSMVILALLAFRLTTAPAHASVVLTGEVLPADPERWLDGSLGTGEIGKTAGNAGSMTVNGGSDAETDYCYLGREPGSTGTAEVLGWSSTWTNWNSFYVGYEGQGVLNVERGAELSTGYAYVGLYPGAIGEVTVSGAKWTNRVALHVAREGTGRLTVEDGGEVTTANLYADPDDLQGNGTVTATEGAVLDGDLRFDTPGGAQTVLPFGTGGMLTVCGAGGDLGAGYKGNGTLTVAGGAEVTSEYGYLGYWTGSHGDATVTGAGSSWTADRLYVGYEGTGTLTVEDGGRVEATTLYASLDDLYGNGSITAHGMILDADLAFDAAHGTQNTFSFGNGGTLTVSPDAGDLGVGLQETGSLVVANGIAIESHRGALGERSGSKGIATVSGNGSKWSCSSLYVGNGGIGSLTVQDRGELHSTTAYLGNESGSSGTVALSGSWSIWRNDGTLNVGESGNGVLTVEDGATVTSRWAFLANRPGSTGTVRVSGPGSTFTLSGMYVPSIFIAGVGGTVVVDSAAVMRSETTYLFGTAVVAGKNSLWRNSGELYVNNDGTLTVADGGQVIVDTLFGPLDHIYGNGTMKTLSGAVLDADIRFDATYPTSPTLVFGNGGTLTVNVAGGPLGAGHQGEGTLTVAEGVAVACEEGYLGHYPGSHGEGTITGVGSKWTTNSALYVGSLGNGTLNVEAGGAVDSPEAYLGRDSDSAGTATVSGAGSIWTSSKAVYVGESGSGELTIRAGGQMNTRDGCLGYGDTGIGIATVTGSGSKWINSNAFWVGKEGVGTLIIEAGGEVRSYGASLGHAEGGTGSATVSGSGSRWTSGYSLSVGSSGSGTLTIEAAGEVDTPGGRLGCHAGSIGLATVRGKGSKWTSNGRLYVGDQGSGTLTLTLGGAVAAEGVSVNSQSLLAVDIGHGSLLSVDDGAGNLDNNGAVRLVAGPLAQAGEEHSPIAAGTWTGTGTYQALGGTWDETTHVFTVSETLFGISGQTISIDISDCQRALIEDPATGRAAGISFLGKTGSGNSVDFTATALSPVEIAELDDLSALQGFLLGGWDLTAAGSGYDPGDPVYLSLAIPSYLDRDEFTIWRFDGTDWADLAPYDLTCTGGYASFTTEGLGVFAIAVPEPSFFTFLVIGLAFITRLRRRRVIA